jgi:hypothetical protein
MSDFSITELKRFIKSCDIDNARIRADQLKKMKDIRAIIEELFRSPPSEDFVKFIAKQANVGFVTDKVIKEYSELTTAVINQYISDRIRNGKETKTPIDSENGTGPIDPENRQTSPISFVFEGKKYELNLWKDMLPMVCAIMAERHKNEFEKVLEIKGRKYNYFSKNSGEFKFGEKIEGTEIYVNTNVGPWDHLHRSRKVIAKFGYSKDEIQLGK